MTEITSDDRFKKLVQVTLPKQQGDNKSAKSLKRIQNNNAIKKDTA